MPTEVLGREVSRTGFKLPVYPMTRASIAAPHSLKTSSLPGILLQGLSRGKVQKDGILKAIEEKSVKPC